MMDFKSVMEEMTGQSMREPIVLRKFLDDYKQTLEADMIPHTDADMQIAMGLADEHERFKTVSEKCDLLKLDQPDDTPIVNFLPGDPEGQRPQLTEMPVGTQKLRSLKALIESKDISQRNPFRRSSEVYKLTPFPKIAKNVECENPCAYYNDLLINIRIYRPTRAIHRGRTLENPVFAEQFQCLGSNLLTELRDKISCICNKYHFYDISDNPNAPLPEKRTDPGLFFITDTFYNDRRNPENADYSAVVLKWAKTTPCFRMKNFKVAKMEETRFIDLTVSLGFPQLYQHHGNCEHLFTFSQVELLTPSLTYNQNISCDVYPRLHSFNVYNNRLCNMCGNVHYAFIVTNSERQLHDPAYLCSKCFHTFHYIDGKKIGRFCAYRLQDFGELNQLPEGKITQNNNVAEPDSSPKEAEQTETVTNQAYKNVELNQMENQAEENYRVIYNEKDKQIIVVKEERF